MEQELEEINIRELFRVALNKWWLLLILITVAGAISGYVTINYITPMYEAKSILFIGKETDNIAGISFSDLQIDDQLVTDYRELIRTRLVTKEVIEELSLNIRIDEFVRGLEVTTLSDSRFININYVGSDPKMVAEIVNQLSNTLVEKAIKIVGVKNVIIVDEAIEPEIPISPHFKRNIVLAMVLGFMISLLVIFFLHMFDNTVRKEEDIEKIIGVAVLGIVPKFKGEDYCQ